MFRWESSWKVVMEHQCSTQVAVKNTRNGSEWRANPNAHNKTDVGLIWQHVPESIYSRTNTPVLIYCICHGSVKTSIYKKTQKKNQL